VRRSENRLNPQQQTIPPGAEVIPVLGIQCLCAVAVQQIPAQVQLAIDSPQGIRRWQVGDPQACADPIKHIVELALLVGAQRPGEQLMCSLGVIDEHVEHIAVGPIRDGLAALALDCPVNRSDPIERARGGELVREDDLLSVARGDEEPADWIGGQLPGEEQPVDSAVERELGGRTSEDEEHDIPVAPDPPYDGTPTHEGTPGRRFAHYDQ
jgi:hypothetical protein